MAASSSYCTNPNPKALCSLPDRWCRLQNDSYEHNPQQDFSNDNTLWIEFLPTTIQLQARFIEEEPIRLSVEEEPKRRESRGPRIIVDPTEDYYFHDCLLRSVRHAGDLFKKVTRTRGKGGGGKERTNERDVQRERDSRSSNVHERLDPGSPAAGVLFGGWILWLHSSRKQDLWLKFNGDMEKLRLLSPPNTDLITLLRQNPKQTSRMNTHGQFPKLALFLTQSNPKTQRRNQTFQNVDTHTHRADLPTRNNKILRAAEFTGTLVLPHQFTLWIQFTTTPTWLCTRQNKRTGTDTDTRRDKKEKKKESRVAAAQIL